MQVDRAFRGQLVASGVIYGRDGTVRARVVLSSPADTPSRSTSRHPSRLARFLPCEITHSGYARNAIADAVADLVDVGTTNSSGCIKLYSINRLYLLATIFLANPAFGDASNGIAVGLGLPLSDSSADNTALMAEFDLCDRDEQVILSGTAGLADDVADLSFPSV